MRYIEYIFGEWSCDLKLSGRHRNKNWLVAILSQKKYIISEFLLMK